MRSSPPSRIAAAFAVLVVGLATILGAWGFQLIGGYQPCKLCLEERIPYYLGLPLALAALVLAIGRRGNGFVRLLLLIVAVIFLFGAGLGTYHAGAEWAFWPGPTDCGGGGATLNVNDLMAQLSTERVVSCTEAAWRLPAFAWGLSFAGWNAAISAFLAVVAFVGATRKA